MKPFLMRALACELVLMVLPMLAAQAQNAPPDLTALKIEDLMNVDVTSAAKKEQKLSQVPGALFVITTEDIRRSGATNIPDLLRMVPGLEVAQINPSTWAISARGFNGQYSNKLLVLIDGRTVYYTHLFRSVLGCSRRATRFDRTDRGHSRPRRHGVGNERREWSDQHYYQERAGYKERRGYSRRGHA